MQLDKETRLGEPPAPDPFLDRTFDGHRVEALIGRGGMGAVYKATQLSLNRPVAIKVIPAEVAEHPQFQERFEREVDILSKLSHPNVVTVHERGEVDGRPYVVMEYVAGTSLREVIKQGPLPPSEALVIVRSVLAALEHAHDRGVVHRDIKPENVLVAPGGIVKVADFGLSRLLGPADLTRLTHTHLLLGTFEYMAPEQREKAKEADERSDLYATGVVLYEMLTGELPIGRFESPSRRRPECDSRIDLVVERSLEKDPGKRWQRASEMGAAVSRLLSSAPLEPEPPPAPEPPAVRPPDPPPAAAPPRVGLRGWHVLVALLLLWLVGVMADASSSTGLNWGVLALGGAAVALVTWWMVTHTGRRAHGRPRPEEHAGRHGPSAAFWVLGILGALIVLGVVMLLFLGVREPAADLYDQAQAARDYAEASAAEGALKAREMAYDRQATMAIQAERHGVIAHWRDGKRPGFVEEWSRAPETVAWLAGLLECDAAEAGRLRLACLGDQILVVLPRETPLDSKQAAYAYAWALQRLAPAAGGAIEPWSRLSIPSDAFRARVHETRLPPPPEEGE